MPEAEEMRRYRLFRMAERKAGRDPGEFESHSGDLVEELPPGERFQNGKNTRDWQMKQFHTGEKTLNEVISVI